MSTIKDVLLGFDFGTTSIGVAVGVKLTGTTRGLIAVKAKSGNPNWDQIEKIFKDWQPNYLVVGLPLNMDGSEQLLTIQTYKFIECLKKRFNVKVELQDERLSTIEARDMLFKQGGYHALKKSNVDATSAAIILEDFFKKIK